MSEYNVMCMDYHEHYLRMYRYREARLQQLASTEGLGNLQVCGDGHGQLGDGVVPRCCAHLEVNFIASYSCHVILYMVNLYGQICDRLLAINELYLARLGESTSVWTWAVCMQCSELSLVPAGC